MLQRLIGQYAILSIKWRQWQSACCKLRYRPSKVNLTYLWLAFVTLSPPAKSHLMIAQHGSLNVVGSGVFMTLSIPVSAFEDIDADNDGKLSKQEFSHHRIRIANHIHRHITFLDHSGEKPLQGMMMSLVTEHDDEDAPVSQLVVMGRYPLASPTSAFQLKLELFGKVQSEQQFTLTAKRKKDNNKLTKVLTPTQHSAYFFMGDQRDSIYDATP